MDDIDLPSDTASALESTLQNTGNTNETEVEEDTKSVEEKPPVESETEDKKEPEKAEDEKKAEGDSPDFESFFSEVADEYTENGEISQETYDALVETGLPAKAIDTYFAGLQALQAEAERQVYEIAGGEEKFREMQRWAEHNAEPDELESFNKAINSDDMSLIKLAVQGFMSKQEMAEGSTSVNELMGETGGESGVSQYNSRAEWMKDSTDPRYKTDPAYRDKVNDKFLRSKKAIGIGQ